MALIGLIGSTQKIIIGTRPDEDPGYPFLFPVNFVLRSRCLVLCFQSFLRRKKQIDLCCVELSNFDYPYGELLNERLLVKCFVKKLQG